MGFTYKFDMDALNLILALRRYLQMGRGLRSFLGQAKAPRSSQFGLRRCVQSLSQVNSYGSY